MQAYKQGKPESRIVTEYIGTDILQRAAEINQKLSDPEKYSEEVKSGILYKSHDYTENAIKKAYDEWEALSTDLTVLQND